MEQILQKMKDMGMEQFMEKSRQELCMSDTVYLSDIEDERELEQMYMELDLSRQQRMLVNDYVACMETAWDRYADVSYVAGVRDTVKLLIQSGILKEIWVSEESESSIFKMCNM